MNPIKLFERNILELINEHRKVEGIMEYSKIDGNEFLMFPEDGFYLHSKNYVGTVSDCRIYFEDRDEYFPAKITTKGEFGQLLTLDDFKNKFGSPIKDIPAVKTPGAEPTLPGCVFEYGNSKKITVYSADGNSVSYIHISQA